MLEIQVAAKYSNSDVKKEAELPIDLPPNLASTAASAIVRQAEDKVTIDRLAKRKKEDDDRIRKEAMEAMDAQRRAADRSGS